MQMMLTQAAIDKLNNNPTEPIVLTSYKLGSSYSFTPDSTDTDIRGTEVWHGVPSSPEVQNANVVKYSVYLDYNLGDFLFGNVGLFTPDGELFALGAMSSPLEKIKVQNQSLGNNIRLDFYLTVVGTDYSIFLDYAETSGQFRLPTLRSLDQLPPSHSAVPNTYVISGADSSQNSYLAYTDRQGLWAFDAYKFSNTYQGEVTASGSQSVTFQSSDDLTLSYFGEKAVQFITGDVFGICRYVDNIIKIGSTYTISFQTPLMVVPKVGDLFFIYNREPLSTSNILLPVATTSSLGVVQVGLGLSINPAGVLQANLRTINDQAPDADGNINIQDVVGGFVKTVQGESPDTDGNVDIPSATAFNLGLVKQQNLPNPRIRVNANGELVLGFDPVTSVNNMTGDVELTGLLPTFDLEDNTDINTVLEQGIHTSTNASTLVHLPSNAFVSDIGTLTVLELGPNLVYQKWQPDGGPAFIRYLPNGSWFSSTSDIGLASKQAVGIMQVGSGLDVTDQGLVSASLGAGLGLDPQERIVALLRTISGISPDANGDINIDDLMEGTFFDHSDVNIRGGIAGLDDLADDEEVDPDNPPPPLTEDEENEAHYNKARIYGKALPFGSFYYIGDLPNAGEVLSNVKVTDYNMLVEAETISITMKPQGKIDINITYEEVELDPNDEPNEVTKTINLNDANADGFVVYVTSDRELNLDDIEEVKQGHLLLSVNERWVILNSGDETPEDLGTAAYEDVIESLVDMTPDRVLTVGAAGILGSALSTNISNFETYEYAPGLYSLNGNIQGGPISGTYNYVGKMEVAFSGLADNRIYITLEIGGIGETSTYSGVVASDVNPNLTRVPTGPISWRTAVTSNNLQQGTGNSTSLSMSQKATTDAIADAIAGVSGTTKFNTVTSSSVLEPNTWYYLTGVLTATLPSSGDSELGDSIRIIKAVGDTPILSAPAGGHIVTPMGNIETLELDMDVEVVLVFNGTWWEL